MAKASLEFYQKIGQRKQISVFSTGVLEVTAEMAEGSVLGYLPPNSLITAVYVSSFGASTTVDATLLTVGGTDATGGATGTVAADAVTAYKNPVFFENGGLIELGALTAADGYKVCITFEFIEVNRTADSYAQK